MDDNEILNLYWARSEQAIAETGRKYGAAVRRVARNILGDEREAEECANDTWLAAWNSIPPRRPDPLLTYLCKIARNGALSRRRASQAQKRNSSFDLALEELEGCLAAPGGPEQDCEARELAAAVNGFLAGQSREDRFAFLRRYWYGDSVKRIAARLGWGEHRVSVRLSRIRKNLKTYLEKEGLL
jgi:RNA polymerase sigma-70 factor (ECF subfamily)